MSGGGEDPHAVLRFLFGEGTAAANLEAAAAVSAATSTAVQLAGPSLVQPPSPPRKTVSQLEDEVKERSQQIAALESIVVRLQDLVVESMTLSEDEVRERLAAIMRTSPATQRLDVSTHSSFLAPPRLVLGAGSSDEESTPAATTTAPFALDRVLEEPLWASAATTSSPAAVDVNSVPVFTPRRKAPPPPQQLFDHAAPQSAAHARRSLPVMPTSPPMQPPPPPPPQRKVPPAVPGTATLHELRGQIVDLTRHQVGCRFLQRQIDWAQDPRQRESVVGVILDDILPTIETVIVDSCGQFLVPKIFEAATTAQRSSVVRALLPHIATISCNAYGSHGLQRLLAFMTNEQASGVCNALVAHIVELSKDQKGNYILQSFLKVFGPGPRVQQIHTAILEHLVEISCHKVGCTVVCRALDKGDREQLQRIVHDVVELAVPLVQDQYGNYVTQHILTHLGPEFTQPLIEALRGHIADLSLQKFSSNVVEKCLSAASPEAFEWMMEEMSAEHKLRQLIVDPYGNFVIQKLLDLSTPEQHRHLVRLIVPLLQQTKSPFAQHIQKKLLHV